MKKVIFLPSRSVLEESARMSTMTEAEIAQDYINLPEIPYGQKLQITKLGAINFDSLTKEDLGALKYKNFRTLKPEDYPAGEDPQYDYTDEDQVSPVVVISGEVKYKVKMLLWFPLSDVIHNIMAKQSHLLQKLLPIEVTIDEKDQWICALMNLAMF